MSAKRIDFVLQNLHFASETVSELNKVMTNYTVVGNGLALLRLFYLTNLRKETKFRMPVLQSRMKMGTPEFFANLKK